MIANDEMITSGSSFVLQSERGFNVLLFLLCTTSRILHGLHLALRYLLLRLLLFTGYFFSLVPVLLLLFIPASCPYWFNLPYPYILSLLLDDDRMHPKSVA